MMDRNSSGITLIIIPIILLLVAILFIPIPNYIPGDTVQCLLVEGCPKPGWNLGPSLLQRYLNRPKSGLPEEETIILEDTSNQVLDGDLANWKTYTNVKSGYLIRTPSYLVYSSREKSINNVVVSTEKWMTPYKGYNFYVYTYQGGVDLDIPTTEFIPNHEYNDEPKSDTIELLDRMIGETIYSDNLIYIGPVENSKYNLQHTIVYFGFVKDSVLKNEFNQILSTFQFLD